MTLGERIKDCRQRAGLSQERAAELVGVSRQAVTKWEAGQAAPSTENLFRLAQALHTTVDFLLTPEEDGGEPSVVEQVYALFRAEEERKTLEIRERRRKNGLTALLIAGAYVLIYLTGRLLFIPTGNYISVMTWLFSTSPQLYTTNTQWSYPYSWLTDTCPLLWWSMAISVLPALLGRRRFAWATLAGFVIGLVGGTLFGPLKEPHVPGHDHSGWLIWSICFLLSIAAGLAWERLAGRKERGPGH